MFLNALKFILIYCVLHAVIVMLAMPQAIIDLKHASSTEEVQSIVRNRDMATRSRFIFRDTSVGHAANLAYRGSRSITMKEQSALGTYQFVYMYNSKTGEIDRNDIKYTPAPYRIGASLIIFAVLYWIIYPRLKVRLQSHQNTDRGHPR